MRISVGLTLLLGLLAAVGAISTDIYLPAFGIIDHDFGRVGAAQITLAAWFAGLAIGQLMQGTFSDRWGRRSPLLYGTLIYSAASIGCAFAPDLYSFSGFRLVAALSGSASMVIPRAVIRDIAQGFTAARMMSRLTLVLAVVPLLAPSLGGELLTYISWRMLFWACGAYGLICTVLVWRYLPDTLPPERRLRHSLYETMHRYAYVIRERVFITHALQASFAFATMFAYVSGSALVYTVYFRLTPLQYGMLFGVNAVGFVAMAQFSPRLGRRFGINRILHVAAVIFLLGYGVGSFDAWMGLGGVFGIAAPVFVGQAMFGLMGPLTTVAALSRHRAHAGTASATMGTLQFGLAAVSGAVTAALGDASPRPMGIVMLCCAALVMLMDVLRPATGFDD